MADKLRELARQLKRLRAEISSLRGQDARWEMRIEFIEHELDEMTKDVATRILETEG